MFPVLTLIALILVIIGALVWGLIALFDFNLVEWINKYTFNAVWFEKLIYGLVGISALFIIYYVWLNWDVLRTLC